jgi:hypothetical protein
MPTERTEIINLNGKYRVVFEQAASTKGVIGFKVEANGDDMDIVKAEATNLLDYAKAHAPVQTV